MKTATYRDLDGKDFTVEYDETAPCTVCREPVGEASVGGTAICPACDCGRCRYCGVQAPMLLREELDGGRSLGRWRRHIAECKKRVSAKITMAAPEESVDKEFREV